MSWSAGLLEPNPKARVTVETVGAARQRVVVVDDFYATPERLRVPPQTGLGFATVPLARAGRAH